MMQHYYVLEGVPSSTEFTKYRSEDQ